MSNKRNEYINQLLSDLKLLEERLLSVKESDTLPFSFFSTSFNHVEKIARSLHELELMQIGEMKEQMEKLVRFLSESDTRNNLEKETQEQTTIQSEQAESPKQNQQPEYSVESELVNQQNRTVIPNNPNQPTITIHHSTETDDVNKEKARSIIAEKLIFPEYKDPRINNIVSPQPVKVVIENTPTEKIEPEKPVTRSLNDVIQAPPAIVDLKRGFSLNDRFLFQRELFNNDRAEMNEVMEKLNRLGGYDEAENYLIAELNWSIEDQTVKDFLYIIKKGFE